MTNNRTRLICAFICLNSASASEEALRNYIWMEGWPHYRLIDIKEHIKELTNSRDGLAWSKKAQEGHSLDCDLGRFLIAENFGLVLSTIIEVKHEDSNRLYNKLD
tara:strand:- start:356 stop:670 length:315 start_codon:yes stop_codon:yes gene_type:complete